MTMWRRVRSECLKRCRCATLSLYHQSPIITQHMLTACTSNMQRVGRKLVPCYLTSETVWAQKRVHTCSTHHHQPGYQLRVPQLGRQVTNTEEL